MPIRPSILIVDDDADVRTVVCRTLAAQGYRTSEASDGATAFQHARADPPTLIVLDLGLPGQDGWTLTRQIRAEPHLEHVPILVMTAYGSAPARAAARAAGCHQLLLKPFTLSALEAATAALLA